MEVAALNNCLDSKNKKSEMLKKEKENTITDGIGGDNGKKQEDDDDDDEKETNHDDSRDDEEEKDMEDVDSESIVADDNENSMKVTSKGHEEDGRGDRTTVNGDVKDNGKEEDDEDDDNESSGSKEELEEENSLNQKEDEVSVDTEEKELLTTDGLNSCDGAEKVVPSEETNDENDLESSDKVEAKDEEDPSKDVSDDGEKLESQGKKAEEVKSDDDGEKSSEDTEKNNGVTKEDVVVIDAEKKRDASKADDPEVICDSKDEEEEKSGNKEQTIIITETKSLAQAINDAVKKPDGKPTLVIIETKTGAATTTTSSSSLSSSSNGVTTVPSKGALSMGSSGKRSSAPSSALHSHLTADLNGGQPKSQLRQSLLQESLLSPMRPLVKPDPGPTVPLPEDAEISVDVPSLVVPYLFECQARETLTHFMKKLGPLETDDEEKQPKVDVVPPEPLSTADLIINSVLQQKSYFDSAVGKFFMDIGLTQVQEWVQTEILKAQQRKLAKGWKTSEREKMVVSLKKTLNDSKKKTEQFQFDLKKCTRCSFESESQTVLEKHMETIHAVGNKMQCCFCDFDSTEPASIFNHLYVKHRAFARLEKFHNFHMCSLCPFEDVSKSRVTRHSWRCQKGFVPEKNLAPSPDYEPPAKRTRLVASVATLKCMAASAARNSAQVAQQHNATRAPPPIRPKPGELRITPSYVQSVLRSSYVPPSSSQARIGMPQVATHSQFMRSTGGGASGQRMNSPNTLLIPRQQMPVSSNAQPYSLQQSQLYQVVHTGSGGVLPVVRGTVGSFHSPPRFTILPTPTATVTTRGPTPVALIPNLATPGSGGVGSGAFPSHLRAAAAAAAASSPSQVRNSASSITNKPNISITPVNKSVPTARSNAQATSSPGGARSMQHQQQQSGGGGSSGNPSYVVCEICDGYIKDLDQLRNHMQWIHKVKIHPKMIHNRPPLNCQKCHYRFFTDQGLERHLLGSHGLVTSSMQENANKGKDGGRCIICGKVFLWKLVVHMAKDHKMTLKPAHLSYKCTVCSATFNMYRLFETHVYEEHSTVAKRVLDTPKGGAAGGDKKNMASSSTKDVVTVRSVPSGSVSKAAMSMKQFVANSPLRSCVECGIQFQCPSNCIRHMKETHVRPCHVKLCRVDKCVKCTAKKENSRRLPARLAARREVQLDDDVMEVDKTECIVLDPPPAPTPTPIRKTIVVFEKKDPTAAAAEETTDDVFDMEVETVDDHSSPGVVHTDVESD